MARIRLAVEADLDAITWIRVAAMVGDPSISYRYPKKYQYPDDYLKHTRLGYRENLTSSDYMIMLYECPSIEDETIIKPVAFSQWTLPSLQRNQASATNARPVEEKPMGDVDRQDADPTHLLAFQTDIDRVQKTVFDVRYGDEQLYLGILACHPDYQRRGAGGQLVRWGLEKAKREGLNVTLFASPAGTHLYRKLGFQEAESFETRVEGEDEYLDMLAMTLDHDQIP